MRILKNFAALAVLAFTSLTACLPIFPAAPSTQQIVNPACGAAPAAFDPTGDVVYGSGEAGCARIERKKLDDGTFAPVRLVVHASGFGGPVDIDTDALTYEGAADGTAVLTSDDVKAAIAVDICTGAWTIDLNDGAVVIPVAQ